MSASPMPTTGDRDNRPTPGGRVFRPIPSGFATLRDVIAFVLGVAVLAHEVFIADSVDAYAIGVGVALTGLPLVLSVDERRASGLQRPPPPPPPSS